MVGIVTKQLNFLISQWISRFHEESQECRPQDEVNCSASPIPTAPTIPPTTTDSSPAGLCREARNGTYVRNRMSCGEFFVSIPLLGTEDRFQCYIPLLGVHQWRASWKSVSRRFVVQHESTALHISQWRSLWARRYSVRRYWGRAFDTCSVLLQRLYLLRKRIPIPSTLLERLLVQWRYWTLCASRSDTLRLGCACTAFARPLWSRWWLQTRSELG